MHSEERDACFRFNRQRNNIPGLLLNDAISANTLFLPLMGLTEEVAESSGEMSSEPSIIALSSSLGAMGPLLRKLDVLLASENQLRRSVKGAIKLLKEDLEEIFADLMELSVVECPNYKARYWMHEVHELSYRIEDCIDNMTCLRCQGRGAWMWRLNRSRGFARGPWRVAPRRPLATDGPMMQVHTATEAKMRPACRLQFRVRRVKIPWLPKTVNPSVKIAELRNLLGEASERHERYQIQYCVSEPRFLFPWNNRVVASPGIAANVGVDEMRGKLTRWLVDQAEQQLKVLSIFGSAGVGKTALIKELYHELGPQFECWAFIRVSRNPDMKRLLGEILSQVQGCKQGYDACTVDNLIDSIRSHLQDKRYFVVIDELWETATWDVINIAFPKGNNPSRIILTTEVKDVAVRCSGYQCASTLEMTPLGSPQDCGKIFFNKVFGSEDKCPHELKDISCKIIASCGGLPLAISAIAGLLANQIDNTELWHHLQQCLSGFTSEDMVKKAIHTSYDALPQELKTCLLYLAIYLEGCTICKVDLLNQWIAEGFISSMEGKLGIAESYFNELIRRGMIQPEAVDHNNEVLSCTVHHIVFDLIAQKSREENFITTVDYSQPMPGFSMSLRRLSLHFSCAQFVAKPEGIELSQVRSIAFFGLLRCMPCITKLKFVRVIILEFWGDVHDCLGLDLSKLCILLQLRYLKVSGHIVPILPSKIQALNLPHLFHLSLPNGTKLPDGIGYTSSLRTLECFDFSSNSIDNVRSLGDLVNLQNLHITCSMAITDHQLERKLVALCSSLERLSNLNSLRIGRIRLEGCRISHESDWRAAEWALKEAMQKHPSPKSSPVGFVPYFIFRIFAVLVLAAVLPILFLYSIELH